MRGKPAAFSPPLFAIAILSMAVLSYQILLMRLFAIIQWHQFSSMMISVALLGYGVAGTVVSLRRERLVALLPVAFVVHAGMFGITAMAAFLIAQRIPFNALEIFWNARQLLRLVGLYLVLFVPFYFAGVCLCVSFVACPATLHRIYGYDLAGGAGGCLLVIVLLFLLSPIRVLQAISALGIASAALGALHFRLHPRLLPPLLLTGALLILFALPTPMTAFRLSEYKGLSQALLVPGARIVDERSSPLGLLTVVENPRVPLRHAPGLSLNADVEPPPQLGIYTDGDGLTTLTRFDGDPATLGFLDQLTSALPYHLLTTPEVLVLGAGAGAEVLQAVLHGAPRIDAVELNAQVVDLVGRHADFAGHLYQRPDVQIHLGEARAHVAASRQHYDLIQVALLDAYGASTAGLYGLSASYLYTVEALQAYLRHLRPNGLLAITRWVTLPPRDTLKLFGTAVTALEREGVADPGRQLALVRGWQTATLLVKNGEFGSEDIAHLRAFAVARSFDTEWYPRIRAELTNYYNVLDAPWFFEGATALLGAERGQFIERYKFDIRPATDDRPYFFSFFRWHALPEILALKGRGGLSLLELGYPVLVATLAQATVASGLLILLPLWLRRSPRRDRPHGRVFVYFASLGLAFMCVEIAFIQKFTLLLANPLYAVAVVMCAFLLFAGLGSRYAEQPQPAATVWPPVSKILLLAALDLLLLPWLFRLGATWPDALRIAMSVALIAPLAFCMGMLFPRGLAALATFDAAFVPWAYGINACMSVVGAILAALLGIHIGHTGVVIFAMALYCLAVNCFPQSSDV